MHDVSDMTTRIRNALQKNHSEVIINNTKLVENIAEILKNEGFIENFIACPVQNSSVLPPPSGREHSISTRSSESTSDSKPYVPPQASRAPLPAVESVRTNLHIKLKYLGKKNKPSITYIQSISKPGLRVYVNSKNLPKVLGGLGLAIVSTSQGVFTIEEAKRRGIGGEVLCYVW